MADHDITKMKVTLAGSEKKVSFSIEKNLLNKHFLGGRFEA